MKKTSKTKRSVSAESIARLADNGKDVSSYFTNKGEMMPPLENLKIEVSRDVPDQINEATRKLEDYRQCTQTLMHRVRQSDLVYEFFFVFSRFEHSLLVTNYLDDRNGNVFADWERFAREMNDTFNLNLSPELEKAVRYYEEFPPKKQVVELGRLAWKNVAPETNNRLGRLLILIRRVRNNLFHGPKFSALLEGDSQGDADLLEYGLTILYACLWTSTDVKEKFYSETKWELEARLEED